MPSVPADSPTPRRRADAERNQEAVVAAAAAVFAGGGVDAPIRDISKRAGVGTATIYRHFPTRADLVVAVYHQQFELLAEAGQTLLADRTGAYAALGAWLEEFAEFILTKQGLAKVLQDDDACGGDPQHVYFLERLLPVCTELLARATAASEVRPDLEAPNLMRAVGSLCVGADTLAGYDARAMVELFIAGLRAAP